MPEDLAFSDEASIEVEASVFSALAYSDEESTKVEAALFLALLAFLFG